jgi:acetyltransferase-like isoleucine patch superfamily enzyme
MTLIGLARALRVGQTVVAIIVVQGVVCGAALTPVVAAWLFIAERVASPAARVLIYSFGVIPSYALFAIALMLLSPAATWLIGARTPRDVEMRIVDLERPLLRWVHYVVAIHIVRIVAGTLFRGSPLWTAYLRLNGARMGRRVYVNTLWISDHNLLEFGDDVVIGADVHLSGHTVEAGIVKTGTVRLGRNVTVGLQTLVDIDVDIGAGCQIGALSFVPKHTRLAPGGVYAGIPVRRLDVHHSAAATTIHETIPTR